MKHALICFLLCTGAIAGVASADEIVTTTDGRRIQLKSDGTYAVLNDGTSTLPTRDRYLIIPIEDAALDSAKLHGQLLKIAGYLAPGIERTEVREGALYQSSAMVGVRVSLDLDALTRDKKRELMTACSVLCPAVVRGEWKHRPEGWDQSKIRYRGAR